MIDSSFWAGRRVLITGHTGFKGSWLSLWLQELGAIVTGYALEPITEQNLFDIAGVSSGMSSEIGDIRDFEQLTDTIRRAKPEIVMHLAAQPLVRRSYSDPIETYSTNIIGLVNLFEAIRKIGGVAACVNVTSDKCYENREWAYGYREIDPMGGYDPYSSSKGCAELITSAYRRSFFSDNRHAVSLALASARAGNVIGGGDWSVDRLIPDILRAITSNRPALIRNPSAIRPWQHVLEPLSGYLILAERLLGPDASRFTEGWNFGPAPDDTRPVAWIAEKMTKRWGEGASWIKDIENGPHEAHFLSLDCLKSHRDLGWAPKWNIEVTIDKIIDWHRQYASGMPMREYTLSQIAEYMAESDTTGAQMA